VKKLTNQVMLADIAKNGRLFCGRCAAVEKLTDQAVLAYLEQNDEEWRVRETARSRLSMLNKK
jgi:hypothetical protein